MGSLEVLNIQKGDVKLSFDTASEDEAKRAKVIIASALERGYAVLVEVEREGKRAWERVKKFDAERGEYHIAEPETSEMPPKKRGSRRRVPMEGAKATAIPARRGG